MKARQKKWSPRHSKTPRNATRSSAFDVEAAIEKMKLAPVSMHCWQGDDVVGFEDDSALDGGIMATGNYPGKASTPDQLRQDLECVYSMLPGKHRSTCTPSTPRPAARRSSATLSSRNIFRTGSTGPRSRASASTSTAASSRTRRPPTASPFRTSTTASAVTGSSTASPAVKSPKPWARLSAPPA